MKVGFRSYITCPDCERKLIEVNPGTETEVFDIRYVTNTRPDYILKCWKCKQRIGIRKVS